MSQRTVVVNDKMQTGYCYALSAPIGRNFDPEFRPELTPQEMLRLGVFCGKYMTDTRKEFPKSWLTGAKLSPRGRDCSLNFLVSTRVSRYPSGAIKDGFTPTIPAVGSSGIAATTWAAACLRRTGGRSSAGRRCAGTSGRLSFTASPGTFFVARGSDRLSCIGPMTAAKYDALRGQKDPHH